MTNMKKISNKPPLSLVPREALESLSWAFKDGEIKYAKDDWRNGMPWSEYINAAMRHIAAFNDGEDMVPDSITQKADHLGAAMACLAVLSTYRARGIGQDDRHTKLIGEDK